MLNLQKGRGGGGGSAQAFFAFFVGWAKTEEAETAGLMIRNQLHTVL